MRKQSNCTADQHLCFHYSDSTFPLLLKYQSFKPLSFFCDCTGRLVVDLVRNPKDRFSCVAANLICTKVPSWDSPSCYHSTSSEMRLYHSILQNITDSSNYYLLSVSVSSFHRRHWSFSVCIIPLHIGVLKVVVIVICVVITYTGRP